MKPVMVEENFDTIVRCDCSDGFGGYEIGAFSNSLIVRKKGTVRIGRNMKNSTHFKLY